MASRRHRDTGETLVEILIAIVLIGVVGSAAFYTVSFGATNSKSHRDFVTADRLLRDYAEVAKQAVRDKPCAGSGSFTVPNQLPSDLAAQNWQLSGAGLTCPGASGVGPVVITATLPDGTTKVLSIEVRTP
jgi:type II secretory pathway pseudopilin PulG